MIDSNKEITKGHKFWLIDSKGMPVENTFIDLYVGEVVGN
jgi:hypothetical protein